MIVPNKLPGKMAGSDLTAALRTVADPKRASASARFFKTGPGEYGAGDQFLGVTVPQQRLLARQFKDLSLSSLEDLLHSKIHEQRLTTLIILVNRFKPADDVLKQQIYDLYLRNTAWINSWDLVDTSAGHIVGEWLWGKDTSVLNELAKSELIWERRIAIIASSAFINKGDSSKTVELSLILLNDSHDLIQKAVGWMLREVGKRIDRQILEAFLLEKGRYKTMPRTALRYAIEKLPEQRRKAYLAGIL